MQLNGGGGITGASPITAGEVTGHALVTVGAEPAIVTLVNTSGDTVTYVTSDQTIVLFRSIGVNLRSI